MTPLERSPRRSQLDVVAGHDFQGTSAEVAVADLVADRDLHAATRWVADRDLQATFAEVAM